MATIPIQLKIFRIRPNIWNQCLNIKYIKTKAKILKYLEMNLSYWKLDPPLFFHTIITITKNPESLKLQIRNLLLVTKFFPLPYTMDTLYLKT